MSDNYTPINWLRSEEAEKRGQANKDWERVPFADAQTGVCMAGHEPTRRVWYAKVNMPAEFPAVAACIAEVCPICLKWGRWVSTDPQKGGRFLPAAQKHFA